MTKHRSVVTGWDPAKVNPDGSTGRPKGVQTAADMRIHSTYDVLAAGIFAHKGIPAITGSPTNSASISPFMAAIPAPAGGYYVCSIDAAENFTINMANVGAVKVYVQQEDYQVDSTKVDSNVVIGVVYGANAIPANSLLLFTTTIAAQTSTSGLTFTPAFKYTGAASGFVRVPTKADLANIALIQTGIRALVTNDSTPANNGEFFYTGTVWQQTSVSNPKLDSFLTNKVTSAGDYVDGTVSDAAWRNNVAFRAYKTAVQAIADGVFAKVTLQTEEFDLGNNFDPVTNHRFVAPVTGVYHFDGGIGVANDASRLIASIYKNGIEFARGTNGTYTSAGNRSTVSSLIKLNAGDSVELFGWRTPAGNIQAEATHGAFLCGHLVTRSA